jgi:hypothetical protein
MFCPVNTASRMESTGMPMQIHASEATVDLLRARNKGHWVTARTDTITAKGKGEMRTYWLTSHSDAHKPSRSSGSHESSTYIGMFLADSPQRKAPSPRGLKVGAAAASVSPPPLSADGGSGAEAALEALEAALAKRHARGGGGDRVDV